LGEEEIVMAQFILFIRGGDPVEPQTPEQIQQSVARYRVWAGALAEQNKLVSAFKLKDDGGRIMSGEGGQIAVDGPFAETKETIGGYFVIEAADYAEAIELAKGSPVFNNGGVLEVRQIEL
jgi:hypothetical protein